MSAHGRDWKGVEVKLKSLWPVGARRLVRFFIGSSAVDRLLMVAIAVWGVVFAVQLVVLIRLLYKALGGPL